MTKTFTNVEMESVVYPSTQNIVHENKAICDSMKKFFSYLKTISQHTMNALEKDKILKKYNTMFFELNY